MEITYDLNKKKKTDYKSTLFWNYNAVGLFGRPSLEERAIFMLFQANQPKFTGKPHKF